MHRRVGATITVIDYKKMARLSTFPDASQEHLTFESPHCTCGCAVTPSEEWRDRKWRYCHIGWFVSFSLKRKTSFEHHFVLVFANEQNSSDNDHDLLSVQEDFYVETQECSSQSGTERLSDACFEESDIESSEPEAEYTETDSDKSEIALGTEQNNSEDGTAVIDNSVEMEIQDANNH
ncbi:hypothetical protein EMCRGX_G031327 [Ephydatia muelleri]